MSRAFLVAYDIREPRRLGRVHRFLKTRALALQYSVFVFEGADHERRSLEDGLREYIDDSEDDVRIYGLPADLEVQALGAADPLPKGVLLVGAGGRLAARGPGTRTADDSAGGREAKGEEQPCRRR